MYDAGIQRRTYLSWLVWCFCVLILAVLCHATPSTSTECLIPPTFDPGIGAVYFCPPAEGERYLIEHARRAATETGLGEDVWVNFRGIFGDRLWINIGTLETGDAVLPAWDALASLVQWMRTIKAGDERAFAAFLVPLEISPTYSDADRSLQQRLLAELTATARVPGDTPLRFVLYHVHVMSPQHGQKHLRASLNPLLSIPSQDDLVYASRLTFMAPGSESKIAVPAGIWTYTWDRTQATRFVAEHYTGPAAASFALKFGRAYTRFAMREYLRQGLNDSAALTPERLSRYIETLRSTGAILQFTFASDWATIHQSSPPK
jgi:hypothetical protein